MTQQELKALIDRTERALGCRIALEKLPDNRWFIQLFRTGESLPHVYFNKKKRQEIVAYLQGLYVGRGW